MKTPVLLFRSARRSVLDIHDPTLGWERFTDAELEMLELPTGHYDLMTGKGGETVVAFLTEKNLVRGMNSRG